MTYKENTNMLKIAIFGGTGLLGSTLYNMYEKSFDVKSFSRTNDSNLKNKNNIIINYEKFDYSIFNIWIPDIIINTIAITDLNYCENNHNEVIFSNIEIAKKLAQLAKIYDSYFIHFSTDHFFCDNKSKHSETDTIIIKNFYANSKIIAEAMVLEQYDKSLIVRTNIIGYANRNTFSFFEWLIDALKYQKTITLFDNYFTSPISTYEVSKILILCYKHSLKGIYNIASSEVINKYDFGIMTSEIFHYSTQNIIKGKINCKNSDIKRALTLGLDVSKIESALCIEMPKIKNTIETLYQYRGDNE